MIRLFFYLSLAFFLSSGAQAGDPRSDVYFYAKFLGNWEPLTGKTRENCPGEPLFSTVGPQVSQNPFNDIEGTLKRLEEKEQTCFFGSPYYQERKSAVLRDEIAEIQGWLAPVFKAEGIEMDDLADPKWDLKEWPGSKEWIGRLSKLDPSQRCVALERAYAFAITQMSLLDPTVPIEGYQDLLLESETKVPPDVQSDRKRAAWAFRYLSSVPDDLYPKECYCVTKSRCLKEIVRSRYRYIFSNRRPLGYAYGMCGRSMNAHYLDDDVTANRLPEPAGWKFIPR